MRFCYRRGGATRDVCTLQSGGIGQRRQLLIGIFGGNIGLRLVGLGNKLPKGLIRGLAAKSGITSKVFYTSIACL